MSSPFVPRLFKHAMMGRWTHGIPALVIQYGLHMSVPGTAATVHWSVTTV